MQRALYRSRQFFGSIRPRVDPTLRDEACALLSGAERALFVSMTARDQQHCLDVYRRLRDDGGASRDLLVAALLHDAGKGRVALWHRVAFVLLQASAPGLLRRLARPGDGPGARPAFYRLLHHPRLGAERARAAGTSERVVALIGEEGGAHDDQLQALHAADDGA